MTTKTKTGIELLAEVLVADQVNPSIVGDVLVPEQCLQWFVNGRYYHVIVEELSL